MGRRLGQHFLARQSILDRIAEASVAEPGEKLVEIGPGRGALTAALLARNAQVRAIELDTVLVQYLRQRFQPEMDEQRITIEEGDILKADLGDAQVVVGNLPYYITSPILEKVFASAHWRRAVFLIQKEVAERVAAPSGSKSYGYLSVLAQVHADCRILCDVPKEAFKPPPKVDSAVIVLQRKPGDPDPGLVSFASVCFRHKRKNLRNNLGERYPKERLDRIGDAGRLRAEQLSIPQLAQLRDQLEAE